ncbi:MAG: tetratricopeptide repeat protein [Nitrospirae bacterium]|nr:tetratricopeptide repeat protein [Nitrospirota bacterium]
MKGRSTQTANEYFHRSQQLIAAGDYTGAIEENRKVLSLFAGGSSGDEALFNIGIIYIHYGNPAKDYKKSLDSFERLINDYPQSPLLEKAAIWVGVLRDMEKLKADEVVIVMEKLKANELVITSEHILRSQQLLAQGSYKESLKEIQNVLSQSSKNPYADRALFYAGLVYAHYDNPEKDYKKSLAYFEQLIKEYPQSHLLEQAKIMIGLLNVIEKAKQVDIEIEKKRKEMTR